jgi:hypothetical protein
MGAIAAVQGFRRNSRVFFAKGLSVPMTFMPVS